MPFIELTRLVGRNRSEWRGYRFSIRSEMIISVKESGEDGCTQIQCIEPSQNFTVSETFEEVTERLKRSESPTSDYVVYRDERLVYDGDIN